MTKRKPQDRSESASEDDSQEQPHHQTRSRASPPSTGNDMFTGKMPGPNMLHSLGKVVHMRQSVELYKDFWSRPRRVWTRDYSYTPVTPDAIPTVEEWQEFPLFAGETFDIMSGADDTKVPLKDRIKGMPYTILCADLAYRMSKTCAPEERARLYPANFYADGSLRKETPPFGPHPVIWVNALPVSPVYMNYYAFVPETVAANIGYILGEKTSISDAPAYGYGAITLARGLVDDIRLNRYAVANGRFSDKWGSTADEDMPSLPFDGTTLLVGPESAYLTYFAAIRCYSPYLAPKSITKGRTAVRRTKDSITQGRFCLVTKDWKYIKQHERNHAPILDEDEASTDLPDQETWYQKYATFSTKPYFPDVLRPTDNDLFVVPDPNPSPSAFIPQSETIPVELKRVRLAPGWNDDKSALMAELFGEVYTNIRDAASVAYHADQEYSRAKTRLRDARNRRIRDIAALDDFITKTELEVTALENKVLAPAAKVMELLEDKSLHDSIRKACIAALGPDYASYKLLVGDAIARDDGTIVDANTDDTAVDADTGVANVEDTTAPQDVLEADQ